MIQRPGSASDNVVWLGPACLLFMIRNGYNHGYAKSIPKYRKAYLDHLSHAREDGATMTHPVYP